MRRVAVATRTGVHTNSPTLLRGETIEDTIVECDKALQKLLAGIQLYREPALGEIDLDGVGPLVETATDVGFAFANQVFHEGASCVSVQLVLWVQQAQRRRRDDSLLHRYFGMPLRR